MIDRDEAALQRAETKGPALYVHVTTPPEKETKVVVGLLPGYTDHGGRYAHVADAWAEKGVATVALDMRGHGKAGGRRGHCKRFQDYLDDVEELTHLVGKRFPGRPAVLFGYSLGGLIAVSAVIARPSPWRALVLSAPFLDIAKPLPAAKRIATLIATHLAPALAVPTGLTGKNCTHDPVRARAYDEDPLVFKKATARWFSETQKAQARAIARAPSLTIPVLLAIGLADPIASVPRARVFFDAVGSKDKTWDGREGLLHELLNETDWRPIADRFAEWIVARAAS